MKFAQRLLILPIALVGTANLSFFMYWFSASEVTAIMPVNPTDYTVEALALNVGIFEVILVLLGVILTALGLFDYTEIKNAAVRVAVASAKKEARKTEMELADVGRQVILCKVFLWGGGILAIGFIAGTTVLRMLIIFGPDGPPPEDALAYVATPATSLVLTEVHLPINRLEKKLRANLRGLNTIYTGKLNRVGADIVMGTLGLPRRQEIKCNAAEIVDSGERLADCLKAAEDSTTLKQQAERA